MNCRQFQLHSSQRWTDMADNLPKMKGLLLTTQYYEWYTGNLERTLTYLQTKFKLDFEYILVIVSVYCNNIFSLVHEVN